MIIKSAQKFMQVVIDVKCMQTKFGVCGLFSFGDFAPFLFAFKMDKFFLQTMDYSPWGQKIESAQKIHASRGWYEYDMHMHQVWWAWLFWFWGFCSFLLAWRKTKSSKIYRTGEAMLNKLGADAYLVKLYLHEFFELILFFDFMDYLSSVRRPYRKLSSM